MPQGIGSDAPPLVGKLTSPLPNGDRPRTYTAWPAYVWTAVASIGIEKIIPRIEHLGVFVRMLSRSALGSPITQLTSHFRKPRAGQQMHIVLVDNGRSERLGMADFWYSLKCIRCGACMNTCPVSVSYTHLTLPTIYSV